MPNIKSAKKRVLVIAKKTLINQMVKSSLKTALKKFESDCATLDYEACKKSYNVISKKIDQAAAKGVIHKNVANRKKSQAARRLNSLAPAQA